MRNTFTAAAASQAGVPYKVVSQAKTCCILRQVRGVYTVMKRCKKHHQLQRFVDDESLFDLAELWRKFPNHTGHSARLWRAVHPGLVWNLPDLVPGDVISHESAAVIHGIPILADKVPKVVLSNPSTSRTRKSMRRHKVLIPADQTVPWGRLRVASNLRIILDLALDVGVMDAVVAAESVLHKVAAAEQKSAQPENAHGDSTPRKSTRAGRARTKLEAMAASTTRFSASQNVRRCLDWSTGLSESPAESLALVRFCECGLGNAIKQQVDLLNESGGFVARVDFLLDSGVLGKARAAGVKGVVIEVDGAVKYAYQSSGGFARPGTDPLVEEKKRQYELEHLGYRVVRLMWKDVIEPRRFIARLAQAGVVV